MKLHYNIRVKGKVQGVFYRASTEKKAREIGLKGFVRNEPDGSVYIEAEGHNDELLELVDWCHRGPEMAEVDEVDVREGCWEGYEEFEVRR